MAARKIVVIGLDCLTPQLVFDQWQDELPTLSRLREQGIWGPLESTVPPITVPAWSSMMTGRDPGELGFYGFRNRGDHGYGELLFATSALVPDKRVWDLLSDAGRDVVVLGVPQTYPPTPVRGYLVSCFLTPSTESEYTYPSSLKQEIASAVGEYILDVDNFRSEDKDEILHRIYTMTERRFQLAEHLLRTKPWDFFMVVEMGPDRIHHGFWKYHDPTHPKHQPGNPYQHAIRDYYRYLDGCLGQLLRHVPEDAAVLVVSDHGAKGMQGGICVNEWLIQQGYLALRAPVEQPGPLKEESVDWEHTAVWGAGGYYARIFLNVRGREPQGIIAPAEYEAFRERLARELEAIPDPEGRPLGTRVFKPEEVYRECRRVPPDLIVYFGDLSWRAVGSLGLGSIYTFENDTGPDDANHAQHGVFILRDPRSATRGQRLGLHIEDVAPTLLELAGVPRPEGMHGRVIR